jgi:MSHA biogenesis protein MshL
MKKIAAGMLATIVAGCSVTSPPSTAVYDTIKGELAKDSQPRAAVPEAVSSALMPPLNIELPKPVAVQQERFNVSFNNLSANQFFAALATGTRYNILVHPRVTGRVTVDLKDVTLFEALDAVRDMYGYDYTVEGNRIFIRPVELRTKIFRVNYLNSSRIGFSDIRVTSGGTGDSGGTTNTSGTTTSAGSTTNSSTSGAGSSRAVETSKVHTASESDFWRELKAALEAIIGVERGPAAGPAGSTSALQAQAQQQLLAAQATAATGRPGDIATPAASIGVTLQPCRGDTARCVVVNPVSGIVVVRAMPDELRSVEAFLKATQISVDRQVMLEAKIIEVQLNDGFQTGINWASFAHFASNSANQVASGFIAPGTTLLPLKPGTLAPQTITSGGNTGLVAQPGLQFQAPDNASGVGLGSMFGFAFQASNFSALISFLESQGSVNVLSSPRIATMNNQKAVLKIGTDELFVTNVTASQNQTIGNTTTQQPPSVTLQSYFSGIVLDVTPQMDDRGNVNLHIRPSVSQVTQVTRQVNLGTQFGLLQVPVPSNNTSETDSIVRGRDGQIIVIGGLMRFAAAADRSQVPGAGDVPAIGALFRNRNESNQKRELVILLRPTIIPEDGSWADDISETQRRIEKLDPRTQWKSYEWLTPPAK